MITVHHLNQSRSKRLLWLLEELGLPYQVVHHERDAKTHLAPESLKAVHPLGKSPVLEDEGMTLCESGASMEYLLDKAGNTDLRPAKGTPAYYQFLQWLHFAEGSFSMPVIAKMMLSREDRSEPKTIDMYMDKELSLDLDYIDETLTKQTYFAGEKFTAADIMMFITLEFAGAQKLLEGHEAILKYMENVQQRKAYKKACELG
jgi:glutathione S-transferase